MALNLYIPPLWLPWQLGRHSSLALAAYMPLQHTCMQPSVGTHTCARTFVKTHTRTHAHTHTHTHTHAHTQPCYVIHALNIQFKSVQFVNILLYDEVVRSAVIYEVEIIVAIGQASLRIYLAFIKILLIEKGMNEKWMFPDHKQV